MDGTVNVRGIFLAVFLGSAAAWAQVTVAVNGPATARPGVAATLTVSVGGATSSGPAGVQWTISPPSGIALPVPAAGAQASAAGKTVSCNAANTLCVVIGMNQNVIAAGPVAQYAVQIPANATPGPAQFTVGGVVAADRNAVSMPVSPGPAYSLTILARQDLNGDGAVNAADVQLMVNQATGDAACSDDLNGDSRCDLIDVMSVILKALGL